MESNRYTPLVEVNHANIKLDLGHLLALMVLPSILPLH